MAKQTVPQVTAAWNATAGVMEFFHAGTKIGEAPVWEAILRRRELEAEIAAQHPPAPVQTPLYFKQDGTPIYRQRRPRRA